MVRKNGDLGPDNPKSGPPICNTNGRPPRSSEGRPYRINHENQLSMLQTLEEGSAISAPAAMPRSGIAAEADAADIDLKPAWIDIRDIAAQPC
jgi:hypothetical protein